MDTSSKATIVSLSGFSSMFFGSIPGLNIIVPLILWQVWKGNDPALDAPAKNVVNFQISWTIWLVLSGMVCYVLMFVLIGFVLVFVAPVLWFVLTFLQTLRYANGRQDYVPWGTIRFLK